MEINLPSDLTLQALQQHLLRTPPFAELPALEQRILLMHALGLSRTALITQDQRLINAEQSTQLSSLFARRLQGEPIAYILGEREFFGLTFIVSPAVLIPRPDTELIVELALERAPQHASVLDMGTGSGAIAIALAHSRADLRVTALDVSADALAIAQQNAARHVPDATRLQLLQSNWYSALAADAQFGLIVSNPPYIEAHDPHLRQGDLRFEPRGALSDEADGLQALRHIIQGAPQHLLADGWLLMEHGYDQAQAVREMLQAAQWREVQSWRDLAGIERVSGGRSHQIVR